MSFTVDCLVLIVQLVGVVLNFGFMVLFLERLTNRCFFIQHSISVILANIFVLFYGILFVSNPSYKMEDSLSMRPDSFWPTIFWATGVFVHMFQHLAIVILAVSRMVALTFKAHTHHMVWGARVCMTALLMQLLFPLIFVAVFATDGPGITYSTDMEWQNSVLYAGYKVVLLVIYCSTFLLGFLGAIGGLIKRHFVILRKRRNNTLSTIPVNERNVVHTVRRGEDLGRENLSYHPNIIPVLKAEASFTLIVIYTLLFNIGQFFYLKRDFPSSNDYSEMLVVAVATFVYPFGVAYLVAIPIIKYKLRNERGFFSRLYRRIVGPTMRDVMPPPSKPEPLSTSSVAAMYHQRRNTSLN